MADNIYITMYLKLFKPFGGFIYALLFFPGDETNDWGFKCFTQFQIWAWVC